MQFGACVLRLTGTGRTMNGYYAGYGAVTDDLVFGDVTIERVSQL